MGIWPNPKNILNNINSFINNNNNKDKNKPDYKFIELSDKKFDNIILIYIY
jgi:hypothetical protein